MRRRSLLIGAGDWTLGCVAVSNGEIERIFAAVPLGCPVAIYA